MWMLGTKFGSSAWAASGLNHGSISPAPKITLILSSLLFLYGCDFTPLVSFQSNAPAWWEVCRQCEDKGLSSLTPQTNWWNPDFRSLESLNNTSLYELVITSLKRWRRVRKRREGEGWGRRSKIRMRMRNYMKSLPGRKFLTSYRCIRINLGFFSRICQAMEATTEGFSNLRTRQLRPLPSVSPCGPWVTLELWLLENH